MIYPALYVTFIVMTFVGCTDRLILFPSTNPRPFNGIVRRDVDVPAAKPVEVWVAKSAGARRAGVEAEAFVLTFNGNADRGEAMAFVGASDWRDRPVEVWGMNYPGYGGSPGPAKLKSIPPAALAAYDALAKHANGRSIFVTGQSLGTTAALHVAAHRPVAGCVLWSPPPLQNMILTRYGWWNLWLIAAPVAMSVPPELNSLKNAPKVKAPAVFVETGSDGVVPVQYQKKVSGAYAGEKRFVRLPRSEHNAQLDAAQEREYGAALDWLWAQRRK